MNFNQLYKDNFNIIKTFIIGNMYIMSKIILLKLFSL